MNDSPGTGLLDVVRVDRRSVVRRAYATSPLRLLTPRNHGSAAWVYASSYGGGLVGGDDLRLTVRVGREASVFLSSQASTKVYRSHARASLQLDADVAAGGQLIVWPDPVVCFAGSTLSPGTARRSRRGRRADPGRHAVVRAQGVGGTLAVRTSTPAGLPSATTAA